MKGFDINESNLFENLENDFLTKIETKSEEYASKVKETFPYMDVDVIRAVYKKRAEFALNDFVNTKPSNHISLYIARDEGYVIHYDEGGSEKVQGKLHIFYERPLLEYVQCSYNQVQQITVDGHFEWKMARCIGEIPSYMFPEIQEKKYLRFDSII